MSGSVLQSGVSDELVFVLRLGVSKGLDHAIRLPYRDHHVVGAMPHPDRHAAQWGHHSVGIASATDGGNGCEDVGVGSGNGPGAEASHRDPCEVDAVAIDGELTGDGVDEVGHSGHHRLRGEAAGRVLRRHDDKGEVGVVLDECGRSLQRDLFWVAATLPGAMQKHNDGPIVPRGIRGGNEEEKPKPRQRRRVDEIHRLLSRPHLQQTSMAPLSSRHAPLRPIGGQESGLA
mmetsp:Transcript_40177/g.86966  ORF Transcript_40177/g.86966 Transcript_40177/m.86966 type:complete len:231 (+) Transcript_40177:175-867(+)